MPTDPVVSIARALATVYSVSPELAARTGVAARTADELQPDIEHAIRTHVQRCVDGGLDERVAQRRLAGWRRGMHLRLGAFDDHCAAVDALGRFVRHPTGPSLQRVLTWAADHWQIAGVAVALVAALVTAALRLGYQRFYEPLGMSPDDVGLDEGRIVARSALGAAAFIGWSSLYVLAVLLSFMAVSLPRVDPSWERQRRGTGPARARASPRLTGGQVVLLVGLLVLVFAGAALSEDVGTSGAALLAVLLGVMLFVLVLPSGVVRGVAVALVSAFFLAGYPIYAIPKMPEVWAWCLLVAALAIGIGAERAWAWHGERSALPKIEVDAVETDWRPYAVVTAMLLLLAGYVLLWVAPAIGGASATDVRAGKAVRGVTFLGLTILDVHALPAVAHVKESIKRSSAVALTGCLLYMGRDSTSVLLYRVKTPRMPQAPDEGLVRIPATDVIIDLGGNDKCKA